MECPYYGHMPTRKISDDEPRPCTHPEHNPPSMMVFENGLWEHICPACGHRQVFRVSKPTLTSGLSARDARWLSSQPHPAPARSSTTTGKAR